MRIAIPQLENFDKIILGNIEYTVTTFYDFYELSNQNPNYLYVIDRVVENGMVIIRFYDNISSFPMEIEYPLNELKRSGIHKILHNMNCI